MAIMTESKTSGSLAGAIAAVVLGLGLVGIAPQAASAASYGYVYVVADKSVCGTPSASPKGLQGNFMFAGGSSTINWDRGDAVIYPRVALGTRTTYQINVECYVGTRAVGYRVLTGSFTASYHQQSIRLFS